MDQLTKFYLDLSTNADMLSKFNSGETKEENKKIRQQMLSDAAIEDSSDIIKLDQNELQKLIAKKLSQADKDWESISKHAPNTNNTNNNIGLLNSVSS